MLAALLQSHWRAHGPASDDAGVRPVTSNPARGVACNNLVKGHGRGKEQEHDQQHHGPDIVPDADVPYQEARRHRQQQRVPRHPQQQRPGLRGVDLGAERDP